MGATGYEGRATGKPWLFQAVPNATVATWVEFFRSLPGRPSVVVGDAAHAWPLAVAIAWPPPATPEIVISEFHLREMLDKHLNRLRVPPADPLRDLAAAAFRGPTHWAVLVAALTPIAASDRSLNTWLMKWDGRIAGQLARHAFRHTTRSTGGVEQHLRAIYTRIEDRRHMFANRERLDRLLLLMTMEMCGSAALRRKARGQFPQGLESVPSRWTNSLSSKTEPVIP